MNYEEESYELSVTIDGEPNTTMMFTYSDNVNFSGFWFYNDDGSYAVNDKGEIISSNNLEDFNLESGTFVRRIALNEGEIGETQNNKNKKRIVYIGVKAELNDGTKILYNKDTLKIIKCSDESKNYVGKYYVEFDKSKTETETETIQLIVEIDEENNTGSITYSSHSGYSVAIDNTVTETTGINFNITDNNNENKAVYAYRSRSIIKDEFTVNTIQDTLLGAHLVPGVETIYEYGFSGCRALTKVYIPYGVTSIGNGAFGGCVKLKYIEIPTSVTSIGGFAFNDCELLTHINIPRNVREIGESAFIDCSELTQVEIPNSVTSLGDGAFTNCSKIDTIIITECNNVDKVNKDIITAFGISEATHKHSISMGSNTITYTKI